MATAKAFSRRDAGVADRLDPARRSGPDRSAPTHVASRLRPPRAHVPGEGPRGPMAVRPAMSRRSFGGSRRARPRVPDVAAPAGGPEAPRDASASVGDRGTRASRSALPRQRAPPRTRGPRGALPRVHPPAREERLSAHRRRRGARDGLAAG
jgi:hypothetical protein